MKIFKAGSFWGLFFKVSLTTYLWNLLMTLIIYAPALFASKNYDEYLQYRFNVYILIFFLSLLWGLWFRKANAELLLTAIAKRQKCAIAILIALIIVVASNLCAVWIPIVYFVLNNAVGQIENYFLRSLVNQMYAAPTIISVLLALSAVFFYKPSRYPLSQ